MTDAACRFAFIACGTCPAPRISNLLQIECDAGVPASDALAQRAIGYEVDVIEKKVLSDGKVIPYKVRRHYPPDVTACIFWLKNRNPKQWRDVQDHVHDSRLDNLTSAELLDEIRSEVPRPGIFPEKYVGSRRTKPNGDDTTRH